MGIEIEKKFLLANSSWRELADEGCHYKQGYIVGAKKASVRVRIEGEQSFLNIKSATLGITRQEYEYAIPLDEANELLDTLCEQPLIEKVRYHVKHSGYLWEIDEFHGDNQGLIVAEVELTDENEELPLPEWIGEEVSDDPKYYNVMLVKTPYNKWK